MCKGQACNVMGTLKHGTRLGESGDRVFSSVLLSLSEEPKVFEGNL